MLDTLRRIVQEVSNAASLNEAMAVIVRRVKTAMAVDACYICLAEENDEGGYLLTAADGLNPASVGRIRLDRTEGLVGLVGERLEPVNLADGASHPRFRYFPETGEERYHAFLGVPIIHYRQLLGVLVVQHREQRLFDRDEVAFLVTIAAQLAGALQTARTSGSISTLLQGQLAGSGCLKGIWGAPGIGIGTILLLDSPNLESVPDRRVEDTQAEEVAFRSAVAEAQAELRACGERIAPLLTHEGRALFDVYVMLLGSEDLMADAIRRIRAGNWAVGALRAVIEEQVRSFGHTEDAYLRARVEDIREIGRRVLRRLQAGPRAERHYPRRCILLSEEVSIAQIAEVPIAHLAGVLCMRGSGLSHSAILARALGVPAVMGLGPLPVAHLAGRQAVVDGYQGRVYIQPSRAILDEFERLAEEDRELSGELQRLHTLPAETPDGLRLALYVNTGLDTDISESVKSAAEGVGLHRTELAYLVRQSFPGEEEQYELYRAVLAAFAPRPVTLRTLDVGGDKPLPYLTVQEDNPFLGWRGIRVTLDHPEIFRTQLRAMLRANIGLGNLRVLFPMISRVAEVEEAIQLLERVREELTEDDQQTVRPPLGAMIEAPAAVYQLAALARRVDFFSIGTNDLTQYLLAVDRNNPRVANLYDCVHPAVLSVIYETVQRAQQSARPIGVCGEMAGDPAAAILLLGMGVEHLSMAAPNLPKVKWVIRSFSHRQAQSLLAQALQMEEATDIRQLLNRALAEMGLSRLVRPRAHGHTNTLASHQASHEAAPAPLSAGFDATRCP